MTDTPRPTHDRLRERARHLLDEKPGTLGEEVAAQSVADEVCAALQAENARLLAIEFLNAEVFVACDGHKRRINGGHVFRFGGEPCDLCGPRHVIDALQAHEELLLLQVRHGVEEYAELRTERDALQAENAALRAAATIIPMKSEKDWRRK